MLKIKIAISKTSFDLSFKDRSFSTCLSHKNNYIFNIEKHFPQTFKCVKCDKLSEHDDGTSIRMCDPCLAHYMREWDKKLQ